jgi:hypothetical protein
VKSRYHTSLEKLAPQSTPKVQIKGIFERTTSGSILILLHNQLLPGRC